MVSKDSELKSHKKQQKEENSERFREIKDVLRKNQITRGVTPEKLRMILEELGPTYIKLGQIMSLHSDFLPKAYCDELLKLNSDVTPMPFDDVEDVIITPTVRIGENFFNSLKKLLSDPPLSHKCIVPD